MLNIYCGSILSLVTVYFPLFSGIIMYDNEFKTKRNKILTKDKIEPQYRHYQTNFKFISLVRRMRRSTIVSETIFRRSIRLKQTAAWWTTQTHSDELN